MWRRKKKELPAQVHLGLEKLEAEQVGKEDWWLERTRALLCSPSSAGGRTRALGAAVVLAPELWAPINGCHSSV